MFLAIFLNFLKMFLAVFCNFLKMFVENCTDSSKVDTKKYILLSVKVYTFFA